MRKPIGLILLLAGAGCFWHGYKLDHSVKGAAQKLNADLHGTWSGNTMVTPAALFMAGGGLLAVAGAVAVLRK